mgnify:FL=1
MAKSHPPLALAIGRTGGAFKALFSLITKHPYAVILAAITSVVGLLFVFSDRIKLAKDSTATLQDFFVGLGHVVADYLRPGFEDFLAVLFLVESWFLSTQIGKAFTAIKKYMSKDIQDIILDIAGLLDYLIIGGRLVGTFLGAIMDNFVNILKDKTTTGFNAVITEIETGLNLLITKFNDSKLKVAMNTVLSPLGGSVPDIPLIDFGQIENTAEGAGEEFAKVFNKAMKY